MSINRVLISGNLTRDPEVRYTGSGVPLTSLTVAVNDRRKNQQTGEWEDYPNFIDCFMFGARGEAVARYITKGTKVSIEGKLRWSQWESDGHKRSKVEVMIDEIEWMSAAGGRGSAREKADPAPPASNPAYVSASASNPTYVNQEAVTPSLLDDDIPF